MNMYVDDCMKKYRNKVLYGRHFHGVKFSQQPLSLYYSNNLWVYFCGWLPNCSSIQCKLNFRGWSWKFPCKKYPLYRMQTWCSILLHLDVSHPNVPHELWSCILCFCTVSYPVPYWAWFLRTLCLYFSSCHAYINKCFEGKFFITGCL